MAHENLQLHVYSARCLQCMIHVLGSSVKLVCMSGCPLQSFAQEVTRGRSVTSGPISEEALLHTVYSNGS